MAAIAKVDHLPFVRTMSLDNYPVLKIQCWPNKEHIGQAAVITTHGCWNVNFSSPEPGMLPDAALARSRLWWTAMALLLSLINKGVKQLLPYISVAAAQVSQLSSCVLCDQ